MTSISPCLLVKPARVWNASSAPFVNLYSVFFDCRLSIPRLLPGLRGKKTPTTKQKQTNKPLNYPPQNQNNPRTTGMFQLALLENNILVLQASKLTEQWTVLHDKILLSGAPDHCILPLSLPIPS